LLLTFTGAPVLGAGIVTVNGPVIGPDAPGRETTGGEAFADVMALRISDESVDDFVATLSSHVTAASNRQVVEAAQTWVA